MLAIYAIIKDTFRECLAKKILLGFFLISTLVIFALASLINFDIMGNEVLISTIFADGGEYADLDQFQDILMKAEGVFAMGLFTVGLFLSIFATADLMPGQMTKGRLDLYLARPISRAQLLIGKYLGAVAVVSANIIYAIVGIWLVIGIKAGLWNMYFLYSGLNIIFMFAIVYAFIVCLGVMIKSTALLIVSAYVMVSLSTLLAQREEVFLLIDNKPLEFITDALYWILPKYYEVTIITSDLVRGLEILSWTPIISSAISGIVILNLGIFIFNKKNC